MQLIPEGPDIPEALLNEHAEGKVVLFCGAGISLDAGYPLFGGLVEELEKRNPVSTTPELQEAITNGEFDFALSIIQRKLAKNASKLRRDTAEILSKRPITLKNHTAALRLSRMRNGTCRLITTNFDRLFIKASKKLGSVGIDSAPKLPVPKVDRWSSILHLHGLLPQKHNDMELGNLVLTSADFGEAYLTESYCSRFVVELLRNFTVVFIGYSLNDRIMRYLLDAISYSEKFFDDTQRDGQFRKPYAFVEHNENDKADVVRRWELKEVTPIPYFVEEALRRNRGSHYRLYDTLDAWADLASGGQNARITLALNEAAKPFLPEDTFGQKRLLWAIQEESGKAAEALANVENREQTASIDWLPFFAQNGLFDEVYTPTEQQELSARRQGEKEKSIESRYLGSITNGNGVSRLKPVSSNLIRWMQWHLDKTELMDWILKNGAVPHPDFSWEYNRRKNSQKSVTLSEEQKQFWDILTSDVYLASQLPASHWFDLRENLDIRNPFDLLEFLEHISPRLEIRPSHFRRFDGHDDSFFGQFEFELKFHNHQMEYNVGQIINTPAMHDGLENSCEPLTQLIKTGLDWLSLVDKASSENDVSHYTIPSISPHNQNDYVNDFGKLVFLLRTAFDKLRNDDAESAIKTALQWREIGYPLFKRLFFYAANRCGTPLDKSAYFLLINGHGKWLWASDTKREVNVYLRERVKCWNVSDISRLCTTILKGPIRTLYRDMSDAEWREFRDHLITRHLAKLEQGGVNLPKRAASRLAKLRESWPYSPPDDQSDEFVMFSGGVRSVEWDDEIKPAAYSSFAQLTPSERVAGWTPEQGTMFRKLGINDVLSTLETLEEGSVQNLGDGAFWSEGIKGLTEAIEGYNDES